LETNDSSRSTSFVGESGDLARGDPTLLLGRDQRLDRRGQGERSEALGAFATLVDEAGDGAAERAEVPAGEGLLVGLEELDVGAEEPAHAVADLARRDGLTSLVICDEGEDQEGDEAEEEGDDVGPLDLSLGE